MKIKKGFILRVVGGENVVVPVGELSKQFHGMINLNETGAFMWKFFSEEHTIEEAIDALCAEYEVERERAAADVQKFADVLIQNAFIE
ncbi:MAG: PqqD family protein [Clostridia bacterium]|nr:PqqD family protein [Clostridia bacterium]MBQ8430287.1 PqqD family protein [Clostridia bacterium]